MQFRSVVAVAGSLLTVGSLAACNSTSTSPTATLNATWVQAISSYGPGKGQLTYPMGIAANASNVVVSDQPSSRVQTFTSVGKFTTGWGTFGSRPGQMWVPQGVALDSQGNTYVADVGNSRIQVFNTKGGLVRSAGTRGTGPQNLTFPAGVAVAHDGSVYVADSGNKRVQKLLPTGEFDGKFLAVQAGAKWEHPSGVAVDSKGNVWVTDPVANKVRKLAPDGQQLAKWGDVGTGAGRMKSPQGIAVDSAQRVYVADTANNRVNVFSASGSFLGMWDGLGPQSPNKPSAPAAVAIVESGSTVKLFIADSNGSKVQVVEVRW